jgi:AcrR family transcriptional regulator
LGVKERKEREKELRRDEIIKTGEKLFIGQGFSNTTMDEIARKCELAKGTLYLYFKSKEELLSVILYRALTELYELMKRYQSGVDDPVERLRMIGVAHFEFYEKYPEHFRLLNDIHVPGKFHPGSDDEKHNQLHDRIKSIWSLNMGIVKDGIAMGVFKESTDPLEVALSLWSISTAMIRMHDFKKFIFGIAEHDHADLPFANFDFLNVVAVNARRIVFSILKNPPAEFEMMK